jgi:diguanylate cyclase (GGDEF)-like protein
MSSDERDTAAHGRDLAGQERDRAAGQRDREADTRDRATSEVDHAVEPQAAGDRQRARDDDGRAVSKRAAAAHDRALAADERADAAHDRELAKSDRESAANDRAQAAKERDASATDDLTGALRRGAGLIAIQREIDRARRTTGRLVAAFVDVDGLKVVNDAKGHAAGDAMLIAVEDALEGCLRSYDVISRVGGDEFVCVLSDITLEAARRHFEAASEKLAAGIGASITVGFAELQADESADDLIQRADRDLLRARSSRPTNLADTQRFSRSATSHRRETSDPATSS